VRIAVIGSFKQHYSEVLQAIEVFRTRGWEVTSPAGAQVLNPGIDFVRFITDEPSATDAQIQTVTLQDIFQADLVFVVAPEGYVGRTTCYEVGRLVQAKKAVYFSERPDDLPVEIGPDFVSSAAALAERFADGGRPEWLFERQEGATYDVERRLVSAD
jgi:hypothetical protein